MVTAEPGKATPDKEVEPIVYGSQTDMKPLGNVAKGISTLNAQETFGDFKQA
jgi:hypothetical protein